MEKTDILLELEYSEANLSVDIQQLDYILDNFNINNVYKFRNIIKINDVQQK